MNAGLATRKKLAAALHPDIHGDLPHTADIEDAHYEFRHGRASDKLVSEFALPSRPFMPNYARLGTPGEDKRSLEIRIDGIWRKAFAIGVAVILALAALWYINAPASGQPNAAISDGVNYRVKAAQLKPGTKACELDPAGCLVCMHKDAIGMPVVSTHC